jgi:dihydrofolate reductase
MPEALLAHPPMPRLSLIVAIAANRVIGANNTLPWRLPEDIAFFKRTTLGHTVIMGRKTFESIGRALPDRRNIVITRNPEFHATGVERAASLDEALASVASADEVFVIGGESLFGEALERADRLLVTEIRKEFAGDIYFPPVPSSFRETARSAQKAAGAAGLQFDFVTYERKAAH